MASSRNLVFLFVLLITIVLFISSHATAAEEVSVKTGTSVQDTSSGDEVTEDLNCKIGRCCHRYRGVCIQCCRTESGDEDRVPIAGPCKNGCCHWFHGHCTRCCKTADQDTVTENELSCKHGCCRWIPHKGCKKCCATADEIPEVKS